MRGALLAAALFVASVSPAGAQSALSTAGDVGSATLRNGYPAGGGAIALPAVPGAATPTAATTAGTTTAGTTAAGAGTGSLGGPTTGTGLSTGAGTGGAGAGPSSAARSSRGRAGGGRGNWVVCPPAAASGEAALLTGTDLSCAPD